MSENYELTREIIIDASPDTVFSFLTEQEKMKEWFAEIVEADPRPGGVFHIGTFDGIHCRGEFVDIVPNEKVVFTWGGVENLAPGESTVEIILKLQGQSTHLTLRHYNIRLKPSADSFGQGWKEHALPLLKDVAEGREPDGVCFESGNECNKN
ncbi:MAG: SRPBCC domain-containing protein [Nitrospinota bacterium]|nr:SRPBCC domain-containing protein [Nitrospinota bacterium]